MYMHKDRSTHALVFMPFELLFNKLLRPVLRSEPVDEASAAVKPMMCSLACLFYLAPQGAKSK